MLLTCLLLHFFLILKNIKISGFPLFQMYGGLETLFLKNIIRAIATYCLTKNR